MQSEEAKMLAGQPYHPGAPELVAGRQAARARLRAFNAALDADPEVLVRLLRALIPNSGREPWIEPPFHCDYGTHLFLGDRVYFNCNCVVLDVCPVHIGSRVKLGPAVQIYTACHPLDSQERAGGLESGKPIRIAEDVWVGGASVLCPGVSIGARSVIGAGSVVTRDIPEDVLAVGNPCRVIRRLAGPAAGA